MHQIQIQEEEDEPELYHEQQHNQNQSEPFAEICRDPPIVVGSSVCGPHRSVGVPVDVGVTVGYPDHHSNTGN